MVTLELGLVVQTEEKQALKRLGRKRFGRGGRGGGGGDEIQEGARAEIGR